MLTTTIAANAYDVALENFDTAADVLKIHLDQKVPMRIAANMLDIGRVAEAVQLRVIYP